MEENSPSNSQASDQTAPSTRGPETFAHKIPVIRTYEHDIEEAIAQKKISSASISIAEADARRKQPQTPPKASPAPASKATAEPLRQPVNPVTAPIPPAAPSQKIIPPQLQQIYQNPARTVPPPPPVKTRSGIPGFIKFIVSILLIGGGLYGGYFLYTISPIGKESLAPAPAPVAQNTPLIPSIITPDSQKVIDISGLTTQDALHAIGQQANILPANASSSNSASPTGTQGMLGIIFQQTQNGLTTQVTAPEFIAEMNMNPPDAFTASLGNAWMFGVDGNAPFLIFSTNFFQNSFAGMLTWEPTLPGDLSALFGFNVGITGKYEDRILSNKNIREFTDPSGKPVFLYGFIDNSTLVIARNEGAFSDIVGRIEKQTYVR